MISKDFTYTKQDIEQAFNLHYAKKYPLRSKLLLLLGALLILTFIVLFLIPELNEAVLKFRWLFLLMGLFYIGFYFYRKKSMVKLALNNPTIKDMNGFEIHADFIKLKGEQGFSDIPYSKFEDVFSDENSVLLYFTKDNFFIIPKRLLSNEEEQSLLQNIKK